MRRLPTPPTARGQDSRGRLLAAATELFAAHGFAAVTMRALGEASGLDNSSLYRHFRSKSALAHAVLDRVTYDLLELLEPSLDTASAPSLDTLADVTAALGLYLFDRPQVARVLIHWAMSAGDAGATFTVSVDAGDAHRPTGRLVALISDWLARGARGGAIRAHTRPDALVLLIGAVVLRPATRGHLLASQEPKRSRASARQAWERELRAAVRGAFAP